MSSSRKKSKRPAWLMWLPVLVGVAITPLARNSADVLALKGPGALQTLYPWVALINLHALGLAEALASTLSQGMMYLQFPLYGLFVGLTMRRHGLVRALLWVVLIHALPLAILLAMPHV